MRLELGERGGLECDMSMEIGLRRQDRLMSEPQRDHRQVDTRLEQFHRGGVSKDMRRYPLVPQRWAMCTRRPDMLCEQILDGDRAEATAVDVGAPRRCSSAWRFLQPVLTPTADLACESPAPLLAALADAPEIGRAHV